jgi:hypothetical protein
MKYSHKISVHIKLVRPIKIFLNEMCSRAHINIYLSDNCLFQSGLRLDPLWQLLFNFALEYAITKLKDSRISYADDVNPWRDNIDIIKERTDASSEVGLEVNVEKFKYMLLSRHQNAGQSHDMKMGIRSLNVSQFKYLGTRTTNQILIQ